MSTEPTPAAPPEAAAAAAVRLNYVPKLVARGAGRVYWDTPDGQPPQPADRTEPKKEG